MTEPEPTYTAEDMGVNCAGCGVAIAIDNAILNEDVILVRKPAQTALLEEGG